MSPKYLKVKKKHPSDLAFPVAFSKSILTEIINEMGQKQLNLMTSQQNLKRKLWHVWATFITENFKDMSENMVFQFFCFSESFKQAEIK